MISKKRQYIYTAAILPLIFMLQTSIQAQIQHIDSIRVFYKLNEYKLDQRNKSIVKNFLNLQHTTIDSVFIIGEADSIGSYKYNDELSMRRSQTMKTYLLETLPGVKITFMQLIAKGERSEAAIDSFGRRVTMIVYRKDKSPAVTVDSSKKKEDVVTKVEKKEIILTLDKILFEPNKPILTPASQTLIYRYIDQLKQYRNDSIEIRGHVNQTGDLLAMSDPLHQLSIKRAQVIYQYLIDAGFDRAKLSYKGMGNSQMRFPKPQSMNEQLANMRVEVVINPKK